MSRTLSASFRQAIHAPATAEAAIVLLTIDHASLDQPFRFANGFTQRLSVDPITYGLVSRGQTFTFLPFEITLPDDQEPSAPRAEVTLDNIARELIPLVRSVATPPGCLIEVVGRSDPDTVEAAFPDFLVADVKYNAGVIQATLTIDSLAAEPFGAMRFTPNRFPGLFSRLS